MKTIGIICEYNPFHNGHLYHIQEAKKLYPDSIIILCLNGYFLQRGEVSILSKEIKTKIALENNVDIVVELPLFYGTQSADFFAEAGISILNSLGVTHLVFGSEETDLNKIKKIASTQLEETFKLQTNKKGLSYPARLNESLEEKKTIKPNTLLAISYVKAILKNNYEMIPVPILRTNSFHDKTSNESIISASNIREKIRNKENILKYLPISSLNNLLTINEDKLFELLKLKILTDSHLDEYMDVTEGLDYKLKKEIVSSSSLEELIKKVKSKRYTTTRIQRMLIHILLGIKKESIPVPYIHILGFNKYGMEYLKKRKKESILPLKIDHESKIYQIEIIGARIYDMLTNTNSSNFDLRNKPITHTELHNPKN